MKSKFTLIALLVAFSTTLFAQNYAGKIFQVGEPSTELEVGKIYLLYNNYSGRFAFEDTDGSLILAKNPTGLSVSSNMGYIFQIESADGGKYNIKTGLGNYIPNPSSSKKATTTTTPPSRALSITQIADAPGHFLISGTISKLVAPADGSAALTGGNGTKLNGVADWSFVNVEMSDVGNLKGRELYDFQMSEDNYIRLFNKRNPNYLTSTSPGEAYGSQKNTDGLSQVWIKEKSGNGYTLLSAETGQYLGEDFGTPKSTATELYFQYSPNNTNQQKDSWCNIASVEDFSGQKCLNLGNDGKTLYKWSYSNDAGSDWGMEIVSDVTEEQIRKHLNASKGWADEIEDGAYYRIVSATYNKDMAEVRGELKSVIRDETNLSQCWQIRKNGEGYTFQNVFSENYVNGSPGTSQFYTVGKASKTFYIAKTNDKWNYTFTITASVNASQGLHTASSQGYHVVHWDKSADASKWAFEKVTLTQEQINEAHKQHNEYLELAKNKSAYQQTLNSLFSDRACTTLKPEIQGLSDEELSEMPGYAELPADIKSMILKIKNNIWQTFTDNTTGYTADYEKFFRIADYKIYSNNSEMSKQTGQSNAYGKLSAPTGIVANSGDIIYIYVDQAKPSECTLQLEMVTTEGVPGDHSTGVCTDLSSGLNIIKAEEQDMLYIFYQLNNVDKYLADYPDIKIHIEGGKLNGYWDATRGMTNNDWKLLQKKLLKDCPHVNLKTENLVFAVNRDELTKACPTEMEGITKIWNTIVVNEERFQGLEDFEGRIRNIWNVFSVNYNYMFASTYGTYYHENTMSSIFNFDTMAKGGGNLWGPSHEMGHNHQSTINMISCTEVSNNLFSNINVWEQGTSDTRGYNVESNFADLANNAPWLDRDIWIKTRLYLQLYFYFHAMKNDTTFYPRLFKELRRDPMIKRGNSSLGREDYLHFAKKCCDIAQADLSEFFESYGFFVPIKNFAVEDYANYVVNTTQADIDAAKAYMQKYPKKLGNIMFINDKVEQKTASPNPDFCAITPADGKRYIYANDNTTGWFQGKDKLGGDLECYDGSPTYNTDGDYFTISDNKVSFKGQGSGWMGHKFYDKETKRLLWATNKQTDTLPLSLRSLSTDSYYVVAAEANGNDVPCPYYKLATSAKRYKHDVYFGTEESKRTWYTNAEGAGEYLPENAIAIFSDLTNTITPEIASTPNVINGKDNTATVININGDLPFYVPFKFTTQDLFFNKVSDGYQALSLPFNVNPEISSSPLFTAVIEGNNLIVTSAESTIYAGNPVITDKPIEFFIQNAELEKGVYSNIEDAYILSSDGKSIITSNATPFTYTFPKQYQVDFATKIDKVVEDYETARQQDGKIYNLAGQRVDNEYKGIVIQNGKKVLIK